MRALFVVTTVFVAAACGREPTRTWRPSDHAQPPNVSAAAPPGVAESSPEAVRDRVGGALFGAQCASCHGAGGRGDGPAAPPALRLPDFTDAAFHEARTDEQIAQAIRTGKGAMPAFGDRLDERAIAALVARVRRFIPVAGMPR